MYTSTVHLLEYIVLSVIYKPARHCPPAVCHVVTVVVVAVVVGAVVAAVVVGAIVSAVVVGAVVAAVVVGAVVVAVVAACGCRRRCVWDLRCDDTGGWSFGWEGLSSAPGDAVSLLCFKSPDAQPRAARAINPHRRPAIDNSKTVSTTTMKTTTIATTMTTTRRHDGLDSHQPPPPPPPPPPCHRQWQDDVNNSNNPDDNDDNTDNTDDIDETMTTGHENDWTRRLGRDGSDATARTRRRALRRAF
ncbi:hypothetical protein EDB85DRAFT_2145123 [Lactarius pseudohatsudake]|nr:hypothetical protein EDB85DRAFT_2145123 [Lactarius pseudohatsudake]